MYSDVEPSGATTMQSRRPLSSSGRNSVSSARNKISREREAAEADERGDPAEAQRAIEPAVVDARDAADEALEETQQEIVALASAA